ncbi:MAG: DUF1634 domain-containing protein [Chloroflexi bacterium]|nr:DUF1634 domain-containing protein [Chloroflexota bacterium]
MPENPKDRQLYLWVRATLIIGVFSSLLLMLLGLTMLTVRDLQGGEFGIPLEGVSVIPVEQILEQSLLLEPLALMSLGTLLLFMTPISYIIIAAITFWMERDRPYLAISLAVLAMLSLSIFLSFH